MGNLALPIPKIWHLLAIGKIKLNYEKINYTMKKVLFTLLVAAVTVNLMAQNVTSQVTLRLTGNTSAKYGEVILAVVSDANPEAYCAPLYDGAFGAAKVAPYALVGTDKYEIFTANSYADFTLGIKTYTDTEYTFKASDVTGDALVLYDKATGKTKDMVEGATYTFEAAANSAIADRFVINPSNVQTAFVCQVAGGLSFHGDQAYTGLQVLDENDVVVEAAFDLAAGEDKFVAIAAAGRYYIKNGEQKIYFVVK